jgi:hypothetical protein
MAYSAFFDATKERRKNRKDKNMRGKVALFVA